jgi:transposase-like protein
MKCPTCGEAMDEIEKNTMSGRDMRTYRCDPCRLEHDVEYGTALWQVLSDANTSDNEQ